MALSKKAKYEARKCRGVCINCSSMASGGVHCQPCRDKAKKQKAELPIGRHLFNKCLRGKKAHGKRRNIEVSVTADFLGNMYESQGRRCFYSGMKLLDVRTGRHPLSPSVDRIDSSKGYTLDNVVVCAWSINRMKDDMPASEFKPLLQQVADSVFGTSWSAAA